MHWWTAPGLSSFVVVWKHYKFDTEYRKQWRKVHLDIDF